MQTEHQNRVNSLIENYKTISSDIKQLQTRINILNSQTPPKKHKRPFKQSAARTRRANIAKETLEILKRGTFKCNNTEYNIAKQLDNAKKNTFLFTPDHKFSIPKSPQHSTKISIIEETTLSACRRLYKQGFSVCALNFASAKNPGGGFLGGSQAQEESLARSSGLYPCLLTKPQYYAENKKCGDCFYTHHIILSKQVPVFRDDENKLIEPYYVSFVTAPAVNAIVLKRGATEKQMNEVLLERMDRVLSCMVGFDALVLGAWGCGVFKNKPTTIAKMFKQLLETKFKGYWKEIVFAVKGDKNYEIFKKSYEMN